ncbi:hypothetical protein BASA83_008794 [Batrachochytrium salamandrivorans]|nr:hypothetical protein BASA83_008794 [Batrachochytrium salamandrivorans]
MQGRSEGKTNIINEQLLRKRAEHNDGELSSLKEIALHQYDIERIENLDVYCRNLEILYLQCNQISKIENLHKLKSLSYLQLALNNIAKIENLELCESLRKLDLTVNFIDDPLDVEALKENLFLRELYLVGNPCAQVPGYREFVITTLPQLTSLDARDIEKSERILAAQEYPGIRSALVVRRNEKMAKSSGPAMLPTEAFPLESALTTMDTRPDKDTHEENAKSQGDKLLVTADTADTADLTIATDSLLEKTKRDYQSKPVPHTPEARLAAARDLAMLRENKANRGLAAFDDPLKKKKDSVLFSVDGRVLQRNEGKYPFKWVETPKTIVLAIEISKFLETSLIDVDVHPTWVRVTIKGKILQLVIDQPVQTDSIVCERSKLSGQLAITMLRVNVCGDLIDIRRQEREINKQMSAVCAKAAEMPVSGTGLSAGQPPKSRYARIDYRNIVKNNIHEKAMKRSQLTVSSAHETGAIIDSPMIASDIIVDDDFADDPSVPPLC